MMTKSLKLHSHRYSGCVMVLKLRLEISVVNNTDVWKKTWWLVLQMYW